jgi:hypothetical protein
MGRAREAQLLVLAAVAMLVLVGAFVVVDSQVNNDCPQVRRDVRAMWVVPGYPGAPMAPACERH